MIRLLYLVLLAVVLPCLKNYGQLTYITELPKKLKENSGLIMLEDSTVWVVEDSGNKDEIYKVDFKGRVLKTLKVSNAKNEDWEDLTKDEKGNVYIADTGNNKNKRKNLAIYKLTNPEKEYGDKIEAEKIKFSYPEQTDFPPKKSNRIFDSEAVFHHNEKLFIITKNRSHPFNGVATIYTVPDKPGSYQATKVGDFTVCDRYDSCRITSIALSPNKDKIAALTDGKLLLFKNFDWDNFSSGTIEQVNLVIRTQLESVCFLDENTLLLSDEAKGKHGGNLYTYSLKD